MRFTLLIAAFAASSYASLVKNDDVTTFTQTCSKPGIPFNYVGCYFDPSTPRALTYDPKLSMDDMTIEKCTAACRQAGYRYAGLEYYFQCFCGATVTGPGLVDASECSYACTGNSSEVCGGFDRLSVYEDPNFAPINDVTIADYKYAGCYSDNDSNGRALAFRQDQVDSATATREICLQACKDNGYSHAGVEYYGECYCGVVLANSSIPVDESQCNTPCNGDKSEACGGSAILNLFIAEDLEAAPPCPPNDGPSTTYPATTYPATSTTITSPVTSPTTTPVTTPTTTKATTSLVTTTKVTTTSATQCTASAPAPTCEYGCGNWCSKPLPWWDGNNFGKAVAHCKLQIASCFLSAGWPGSLQCLDFARWCGKLPSYSDKNKFMKSWPPANAPPTPSGLCTPTSTPTASKSVVAPTATGVCILPTGTRGSGYESGKCVGDIQPPYLTCNDVYSDWRSNPFKLYTDKSSKNCQSYGKGDIEKACKDACKVQYKSCVDTFAQSCKSKSSGPSYSDAVKQCKAQFLDCLNANDNVKAGNRCGSWNGGWS